MIPEQKRLQELLAKVNEQAPEYARLFMLNVQTFDKVEQGIEKTFEAGDDSQRELFKNLAMCINDSISNLGQLMIALNHPKEDRD